MATKTLLYRVSLSGIKGFTRLYALNPATTLYSFHKQLRSDLEFPQDQLILFKALLEDGSVEGRYGLFDLGCGAVDAVTLEQTVSRGVVSFVYFYDVTARKSVNITFEGESETVALPALDSPVVVETKGPVPQEFENGYIAYEDLPDDQKHIHRGGGLSQILGGGDDDDIDLSEDEDDEEDIDEDDDEDGKEIFDESEGI